MENMISRRFFLQYTNTQSNKLDSIIEFLFGKVPEMIMFECRDTCIITVIKFPESNPTKFLLSRDFLSRVIFGTPSKTLNIHTNSPVLKIKEKVVTKIEKKSDPHDVIKKCMMNIPFNSDWDDFVEEDSSLKFTNPKSITPDTINLLLATIKQLSNLCIGMKENDVSTIVQLIGKIIQTNSVDINKDKTKDDIFIVESLLDTYEKRFGDKHLLIDINIVNDQSIIIIGDIHGDLGALYFHLLFAFEHGTKILFLGDFLDRGPNGIEVLFIPILLRILFPFSVYLIRGNHETKECFSIYGTGRELQTKGIDFYDRIDYYNIIDKIVNHFPIVALIHTKTRKIACVHGLFTEDIQLADLRRRKTEIMATDKHYILGDILSLNTSSVLCNSPSTEIQNILQNLDLDGKISTMMWSDPGEHAHTDQSPRGAGYQVGTNSTGKFLTNNNIELIVRAHQVVKNGYNASHNNLVYTVFGQPNYCGQGNRAGFLWLDDEHEQFHTFLHTDIENLTIGQTKQLLVSNAGYLTYFLS